MEAVWLVDAPRFVLAILAVMSSLGRITGAYCYV